MVSHQAARSIDRTADFSCPTDRDDYPQNRRVGAPERPFLHPVALRRADRDQRIGATLRAAASRPGPRPTTKDDRDGGSRTRSRHRRAAAARFRCALAFELTTKTAPSWLAEHGLNPRGEHLVAVELEGGVSASVIAVTGPGVSVIVKQALPKLRVADRWEANVDRTETEAAALQLLGELTPGVVPRILAHDPQVHVVAMELLPAEARNWQAEIGEGRAHPELGRWAGETLGVWHAGTAERPELAGQFDRFDAFEELRLSPFHETVMVRRPELADAVGARVAELRSLRRCLVDGDYAPKNMLVAPDGRAWVFDLEVAHIGNPVFDLAFFLSFVLLSAVRWPTLAEQLRDLVDGFLVGYAAASGSGLAGDAPSITAHTACLMLARTDGLSPAAFLDDHARDGVRAVAAGLLAAPEEGLWSWR
jgi:Phosphotransferase enzyme family